MLILPIIGGRRCFRCPQWPTVPGFRDAGPLHLGFPGYRSFRVSSFGLGEVAVSEACSVVYRRVLEGDAADAVEDAEIEVMSVTKAPITGTRGVSLGSESMFTG